MMTLVAMSQTADFEFGISVGERLRKFRGAGPLLGGQKPFVEDFANDAWFKSRDQFEFLRGVEEGKRHRRKKDARLYRSLQYV